MRDHITTAGLEAVAIALALAGSTCSFPTDKSDEVFVTVELPGPVVLRGEKLDAYARVWQRIGADSAEILNVDFDWSTDNDAIATVKEGGFGSAEITGVNSGTVGISARAVAFEKAQNAYVLLRVANPLEVDSVRPSLVRFGDTVTVFGVGVDSILFASLGAADLIPYPFSAKRDTTANGDTTGFARISFWVPPPAHSARLFFIGNGVFAQAADTTRVLPFDIFEPNDIVPHALSLDGARPFPGVLSSLILFNPALSFEPLKRDVLFGADWYRFSQSTARDVTLIINSAEVRGTFSTFLTDDLFWDSGAQDYFIGPDSWTIGPSSHACHGRGFAPPEARAESTVVALRNVPPGVLHAISIYSEAGPYGLGVIDGYVVTDPVNFPRDDREEDDFCNPADLSGNIVSLGFRDTLTIDNPHDVDWIRLTVPALQTVRLRTTSLVPAADDSSDIDLYVLRQSDLALAGRADTVGSKEDMLLLNLAAGDYYAVVVDYAGVPTRYAICIGGCAVFPAGEPQAAAAPSRPARRKAPAASRPHQPSLRSDPADRRLPLLRP